MDQGTNSEWLQARLFIQFSKWQEAAEQGSETRREVKPEGVLQQEQLQGGSMQASGVSWEERPKVKIQNAKNLELTSKRLKDKSEKNSLPAVTARITATIWQGVADVIRPFLRFQDKALLSSDVLPVLGTWASSHSRDTYTVQKANSKLNLGDSVLVQMVVFVPSVTCLQ